jgi:hypothetical protein
MIQQGRRARPQGGSIKALVAKPLSTAASGGDHSTLLKRHPSIRWDHEDAARPGGARAEIFRWFHDRAGTASGGPGPIPTIYSAATE